VSSDDEIRRIERAYTHYDTTPTEQAKRHPSNPGNILMRRERERLLGAMVKQRLGAWLEMARVLDAGCGRGDWLAWLNRLGVSAANLHGVDLLEDRIAAAREAHPTFDFVRGNAEEFTDGAPYDLIICATVFSSILDDGMASRLALNLTSLLAPRGAIVWYDVRYRNSRNPRTRPLTRQAIRALFPGFVLDLHAITVLPPIARRLGWASSVMYPVLASVPALLSHLAGLLYLPHRD